MDEVGVCSVTEMVDFSFARDKSKRLNLSDRPS